MLAPLPQVDPAAIVHPENVSLVLTEIAELTLAIGRFRRQFNRSWDEVRLNEAREARLETLVWAYRAITVDIDER
jgi:hypothetical protein